MRELAARARALSASGACVPCWTSWTSWTPAGRTSAGRPSSPTGAPASQSGSSPGCAPTGGDAEAAVLLQSCPAEAVARLHAA
ncbi:MULTISPECIES: hypothetical protein [Streptomyces]|uniref:hypothetical protein n=1 Tax=Streptomyces TaxID=1883 RepID=UPI0033C63B28